MPMLPNMVCTNLMTDEAVPALSSVVPNNQFMQWDFVKELAKVNGTKHIKNIIAPFCPTLNKATLLMKAKAKQTWVSLTRDRRLLSCRYKNGPNIEKDALRA